MDHKNQEMLSDSSSDTPEGEYSVEAIKDHRIRKNKAEFYIKWKGYPDDQSTWEPLSNLEGAQELLFEYCNSKNLLDLLSKPEKHEHKKTPKAKKEKKEKPKTPVKEAKKETPEVQEVTIPAETKPEVQTPVQTKPKTTIKPVYADPLDQELLNYEDEDVIEVSPARKPATQPKPQEHKKEQKSEDTDSYKIKILAVRKDDKGNLTFAVQKHDQIMLLTNEKMKKKYIRSLLRFYESNIEFGEEYEL